MHWRLRGERLRLQGNECEICGTKHFPPRAVCPDCTPVGTGTVELVLEHVANETREIELTLRLAENNLQVRVSLNGKSHSIKFKAGMQLPVFTKKLLKEEKPVYFVNPNSLPSK